MNHLMEQACVLLFSAILTLFSKKKKILGKGIWEEVIKFNLSGEDRGSFLKN